jgi:hypothetical protein
LKNANAEIAVAFDRQAMPGVKMSVTFTVSNRDSDAERCSQCPFEIPIRMHRMGDYKLLTCLLIDPEIKCPFGRETQPDIFWTNSAVILGGESVSYCQNFCNGWKSGILFGPHATSNGKCIRSRMPRTKKDKAEGLILSVFVVT